MQQNDDRQQRHWSEELRPAISNLPSVAIMGKNHLQVSQNGEQLDAYVQQWTAID